MPPSGAPSVLEELRQATAELERRQHARDPIAFAKHLGITPDPWQARVLTHAGKRLLLNCCRQSGKSTTTAILALHRALYTPRALVLIVSPSQRQSRELLRKIVQLVPLLPVTPEIDAENTQTVEFANGSRIVSLPSSEDTIRGFSAVSLLIIDEAGDVDDKLYRAVRPMLAVSNGQLVVLGTPKGRKGFYFESWERGGPSWERIEIRASDCPRIAKEFLDEERTALGDAFDQEYGARFVNLASGRVYNGFDETRNLVEALPKADKQVPWTYLLGLDFGVRDDTAFTVIAYRDHDPTVYLCESYKLPGLSPSDMAHEVRRLEQSYSFSRIVGDVGGLGKAFQIEAQQRFHLPIEPAEKVNKLGFIALINGDLRSGTIQLVRSRCVQLVDEWASLSWVETDEGKRKENPSQPNHCCFVGGTLIATPEGQRPIESVRRGDLVLTRRGPRRVLAHGMTGVRPTWRLTTEAGRILIATDDHPVFVERWGWRGLSQLSPGDALQCLADITGVLRSSTTAAFRGTDTPTLPTALAAPTSATTTDTSIAWSTRTTTGRSRRATTFIIWITTRPTTPPRTWGSCPETSIYGSTLSNPTASLSLASTSGSPVSTLPHGMPALEGWRGIRRMLAVLGSTVLSWSTRVWSAAVTSALAPITPTFALPSASPSNGGTAGSMMWTGLAPRAGAPSESTAIRSPAVARDHVLRVEPTGIEEPVFNLTVADEPEYFANGVVVHNCDSALYVWRAAVAWGNRPLDDKPVTTEARITEETANYWTRIENELQEERSLNEWEWATDAAIGMGR